jgi:hypothetical protein
MDKDLKDISDDELRALNRDVTLTANVTDALAQLQSQIMAAILDTVCQMTIALADFHVLDLPTSPV